MNKTYQKLFSGDKNAGFTLIELLVVVLIIGILAAVALPKYEVAVLKSRLASTMGTVHSLASSAEVYYLANGAYPPDRIADLDLAELTGCQISTGQRLECGDIWYDLDAAPTFPNLARVSGEVYQNGSRIVLYYQYLQNSPIYAGERHCIAADSQTLSHQVCKSLGGILIEDKTYRLP